MSKAGSAAEDWNPKPKQKQKKQENRTGWSWKKRPYPGDETGQAEA